MRTSKKRILHRLLQSKNRSASQQNQEVLRITVLPIENWTWAYRHISRKNRGSRVRRVLVVWSRRAVRYTSVHQVPKMEDRK